MRQDEATGAHTCKLDDNETPTTSLSATSLRIDQDAHRLREGRGLHGPFAVVHMPSVEQLVPLIVGFDDPVDHARSGSRLPFEPQFKAA